jgi:hypothetical protein
MTNNPVRILERFTILAPLGVRFWDALTNSIIADGLRVTAYPFNNPARIVQGFPNRSGTYVLQNLPGMRDIENGAGDAEFWANLPPKRPFVVEVIDHDRRFQPFLLSVDLPVKGVLTLECAPESPPSPLDTGLSVVPLYSAPARPVPGAMAVLRASLWNPLTKSPAAWAMIEAYVAGRYSVRAHGFADEQGRIALIFPYPEPIDFADDPESPVPLAVGPKLTEQVWSVQLYAAYTPLSAVPAIMDLHTILTQAPADLWQDAVQTQQLSEVQLKFGQELTVRSSDAGKPLSNLFITPTA